MNASFLFVIPNSVRNIVCSIWKYTFNCVKIFSFDIVEQIKKVKISQYHFTGFC
jgi:hypothetical protein